MPNLSPTLLNILVPVACLRESRCQRIFRARLPCCRLHRTIQWFLADQLAC